ncbi:centrosomal protein of 83 kDa-like isoform X2 [Zophobas morio]|uniref:centrosomal protein of 83 kDa-like isoform X2 n=1 Tax=Zophobas morio TaxID=2755281 RepID=UPI0030836290
MSYVNKKLRAFHDVNHVEVRRKRSEGRMKTYISAIDARSWCGSKEDRRQHILDLIRQGDGKGLSLGKYIPIEAIIDILLANKNADIKRLQQEIAELKAQMKEHGISYEEKPVRTVEPGSEHLGPQASEAAKSSVKSKRSAGEAPPKERGSQEEIKATIEQGPTEEWGMVELARDEEGAAAVTPGEEAAAAPEEELLGGAPKEEIAKTSSHPSRTGVAEEGIEEKLSADKAEKISKTSSHPSRAGMEAEGIDEKDKAETVQPVVTQTRVSRTSFRDLPTIKRKSSDTISGMELQVITVGGVPAEEEMKVVPEKGITEVPEKEIKEVVEYREEVEALYRALAMEAIQQLEAIRNIVEAGDAQPGTSQPESGRRKSKESIKSGTGSHKSSEKLTAIAEEAGVSQPAKSSSRTSRGSEGEKDKVKPVVSAPVSNQLAESPSRKSNEFGGETGIIKTVSSAPARIQPFESSSPQGTELRRRLDGLRGLEDEVKNLKDKIAKRVEPSGDSNERDKLKAEMDECQMKLKELDILKIEKNCLKGRCKDLEAVQIEYENLLKRTAGFETMKAQCSMYKTKYDEVVKLSEENIQLRNKSQKTDDLEKEREMLLKQIEECECCINNQDSELKRLTCHIQCLSEEINKQREQGTTKTLTIKARLKKQDLKPESHVPEADEDAPPACEATCLRTRITELEDEVAQLENQIAQMKKARSEEQSALNESHKEELAAKDAMHSALQESFNATKSNYNALDSNYQALQANYKTLEEKYKALEENYAQLDAKYKSSVEKYNELEAKYDAAAGDYDNLRSQYKATEASYKKLDASYKALEIKYKTLDTTFKHLQDSRKVLEENIKSLQENNKTCIQNLESEKNNSHQLSEALRRTIKNDDHLKQMLKQTKCAIKCITLKLKKNEIIGPVELQRQKEEFCKKMQELQGLTEAPCGAEKIFELEEELTKANATIKCLRGNLNQLKGVMDKRENPEHCIC